MTDPTSVGLDELLALRLQAAHSGISSPTSRQAVSGQHSSRAYGRGMNYAESRHYQAGDDVRHLDWRLTARSGKPHTKLFEEDRQGCLMLLVDTHATMRFGTRECFKSVTAARAAALASWMAVRSGEKVGLASFGDDGYWLKPMAGKRAALAICSHLAGSDRQPTASLNAQLERIRRLSMRPDRLLLISDGFAIDAPAAKALTLAARHSRLSLLGIMDAIEAAPPAAGNYRFQLAGKPISTALFGRSRRAFHEQLSQGQRRLQQLATQRHLTYRPLTASAAIMPVLRPLLGSPLPGKGAGR